MKENGVIRRRLSGKEADPYIGQARKILGEMKNIMQLGGIKQLSWTKDLQNGVRIMVSSIFGQDEVRIFVPVVIANLVEEIKRSITRKITDFFVFSSDEGGLRRWSRTAEWEVLESWDLFNAKAVSKDGETIVGMGVGLERYHVTYKWTDAGGLKKIEGIDGWATCVSQDGTIIAGIKYLYSDLFIWREGSGVQYLGKEDARLVGISDDGGIVAGFTLIDASTAQAWIWSAKTNFQSIGDFFVTAISADGNVVTGYYLEPDSYWGGEFARGVVWTKSTGTIVTLPFSSGQDVRPLALSGDGKIVVGRYQELDSEGYIYTYSFKWTAETGIVLLFSRFAFSQGINNFYVDAATSISDDGTYIVGNSLDTAMLWINEVPEEIGAEGVIAGIDPEDNAKIFLSFSEKEITEDL